MEKIPHLETVRDSEENPDLEKIPHSEKNPDFEKIPDSETTPDLETVRDSEKNPDSETIPHFEIVAVARAPTDATTQLNHAAFSISCVLSPKLDSRPQSEAVAPPRRTSSQRGRNRRKETAPSRYETRGNGPAKVFFSVASTGQRLKEVVSKRGREAREASMLCTPSFTDMCNSSQGVLGVFKNTHFLICTFKNYLLI